MARERQIVEQVIETLRDQGALLATVESCTGGLIAHRITNIPGASQVFWGGIISYQNSAKQSLIGVPATVIDHYGVISAEVATAMAEQGLKKMREALSAAVSQLPYQPLYCLSTTGMIGPAGGTAETPVGTCYFGLATLGQSTQSECLRVPQALDRLTLKDLFVQNALAFLARSFKP